MARSATENDPPALVTKIEAARLLGVSRHTIIRLVRRGALREVHLSDGMMPRLRREDVVALARGDRP
jgi:excisionase family DNA binding protein